MATQVIDGGVLARGLAAANRKTFAVKMTKEVIRKLPARGATESQPFDEKKAVAKWFSAGRGTWYAVEGWKVPERFTTSKGPADDYEFFGYVVSPLGEDCDEWGYFTLSQLHDAGCERDRFWEPKPIPEVLSKEIAKQEAEDRETAADEPAKIIATLSCAIVIETPATCEIPSHCPECGEDLSQERALEQDNLSTSLFPVSLKPFGNDEIDAMEDGDERHPSNATFIVVGYQCARCGHSFPVEG